MNTRQTRTTLIAAILLTGSAYITYQAWRASTNKPRAFTIGVISPSTAQLASVETLIRLAEADINAHYRAQGTGATFNFEVADAGGSGETHLNIVKGLKAQGVSVIIGGAWSSQARASLPYANENGVVLVSPASTAADLSLPGDNLFRLRPDDAAQGQVIAGLLRSWGAETVIVIQRGDAWADSIADALTQSFTEAGGAVHLRTRYDPAAASFTGCLEPAEDAAQGAAAIHGADRVNVVLVSLHEAAQIVTEAEGYPTIYGLTWFGSDGTALNAALTTDAPEQAGHLKLLSPLASPAETPAIQELRDRYASASGEALGSRQSELSAAGWYDAAWICAKAIVEAGTADAAQVKLALPGAADDEYATGPCRLNAAGDRAAADHAVWGYAPAGDACQPTIYGHYEGATGDVTWGAEALGLQPGRG